MKVKLFDLGNSYIGQANTPVDNLHPDIILFKSEETGRYRFFVEYNNAYYEHGGHLEIVEAEIEPCVSRQEKPR